MKTLKLLLVLIPLAAFFNCDNEVNEHIKVDKYVKLLKSNKYNNAQLPAFTLFDMWLNTDPLGDTKYKWF